MPFSRFLFLGEGSPTKTDYRKKGTLFLTSPLGDLDGVNGSGAMTGFTPARFRRVWIR